MTLILLLLFAVKKSLIRMFLFWWYTIKNYLLELLQLYYSQLYCANSQSCFFQGIPEIYMSVYSDGNAQRKVDVKLLHVKVNFTTYACTLQW